MAGLTGQTLGRYKILELVGGGGMSTVYKAYDLGQERYVALKVLSPALAQRESFSDRFTREANLVVQLKHPHIVPVYDFGKEKGYSYLVMPYLDAGSLADYIEGSPLTLAWIAEVMDQIADALDYAHQRGVVHRDLKPSNMLLDKQGRILLADFGVAHIHNSQGSLTGSALLGTPAYISPEQALSKKVDHRSDQYSLGVLLFQLSTGQLPFVAESQATVLLKHIHAPLPLPRAINPSISEPLERVILKAAAKDPDHRFPSVAKMNEALQMAAANAIDPRAHPAPEIALVEASGRTDVREELRPPDRRNWLRRAASTGGIILLLAAILPIWALGAMSLQGRDSNSAGNGSTSVPEMFILELTVQAEIIEAMSTEISQTLIDKFDDEQIQGVVRQTLQAQIKSITTPLGDRPTSTATDVSLPNASWTTTPPADSTAVQTASPTQPVSSTPVQSATPTQPVSSTAVQSATPTQPVSSTPVQSATPTSSSTPPTPSLTPTLTATPSETATQTVVENVCDTANLVGFSVSGNDIKWTFNNNGSSTIQITQVTLNWPSSNKQLKRVFLGGIMIWKKTDASPPTSLAPDWKNGAPQISSGETKNLIFRFAINAATSGYSLIVTLDDSCQISRGV